jgi:hypothetical protein
MKSVDMPDKESTKIQLTEARAAAKEREARLIANHRRTFVERYVLAVAAGGSVPNLEFDLEHAGKLYDAIYPEESQ